MPHQFRVIALGVFVLEVRLNMKNTDITLKLVKTAHF